MAQDDGREIRRIRGEQIAFGNLPAVGSEQLGALRGQRTALL
jgi:hypothetical protein